MSILNRIRGELDHTRRIWHGNAEYMELLERFDNATNVASAAVQAHRIADLLRAQAGHLEASTLARATTALPAPEALRDTAREWSARAAGLRKELSPTPTSEEQP